MPTLNGAELAEPGMIRSKPTRRNVTAITDAGRNRLEEFDKILPEIQDWLLVTPSPAERIRLVVY